MIIRAASSTLVCAAIVLAAPVARPAENLSLRQNISFEQDVDSGFPIIAEHIDDVALDKGRSNFIFFGASGDMNTNRQAKRVVELYKRVKPVLLKFIIIDVDRPTSVSAKHLIREHYQGYIPCQVLIGADGRKLWSQSGECDLKVLEKML